MENLQYWSTLHLYFPIFIFLFSFTTFLPFWFSPHFYFIFTTNSFFFYCFLKTGNFHFLHQTVLRRCFCKFVSSDISVLQMCSFANVFVHFRHFRRPSNVLLSHFCNLAILDTTKLIDHHLVFSDAIKRILKDSVFFCLHDNDNDDDNVKVLEVPIKFFFFGCQNINIFKYRFVFCDDAW